MRALGSEAKAMATEMAAPAIEVAQAAAALHTKAAAALKTAVSKVGARVDRAKQTAANAQQQMELKEQLQVKSDRRKDAELSAVKEQLHQQKVATAEAVAEAERQEERADASFADFQKVKNYLEKPIGRPPDVIPAALRENWEHHNSLKKKQEARDQGAIADQVEELKIEVAFLENNGSEPVFVKDDKENYSQQAKLLVFEMLTHMASAESIEKDLISMHAYVYPDLERGEDYHIPDATTIGDWRASSQFFTEIIAAVRAGKAKLWKQLFHDGSSDRVGTKIFTTLLSIPDEENDEVFDILLIRGLHIIAGGESASELEDIRRTMTRMKEKLTFLRNELQRLHPELTADAINRLSPLPSEINLRKLAGGSAMGDNAAGAKKVSELLAAAMEKDAAEFFDGIDGRALWANMSEADRIKESVLYLFTCWNHIRNLMCNEAVKQETACLLSGGHISQEELDKANKAWGRSDAGSTSGMMRGSFKEFATLLDNYKKGHGNDFEWWLQHVWAEEDTAARRQEVKDGVFLYPMMRLDHGGRFDTQLDGAIAALMNCDKWLPFLKYRIEKNRTEKNPVNALEDYLATHYQSAPVMACLRARVALAVKVNGPLRALTNQTVAGKRRDPLAMAGPCEELWDFALKLSTDSSFLFAQGYESPFSGAAEADSWLRSFKARKIEGFTTNRRKVQCEVWPQLERLLHTEQRAPDGITFEVSQAHARGILISLNRNAANFLPARKHGGSELEGGKYCVANQDDKMRENCRGMEATNDCAESTFALFDYICRRSNGLTIQSASGVTQMVFNGDLARGSSKKGKKGKNRDRLGWFHRQDPMLQNAIFKVISVHGRHFRQQNKADEEEQKQRAAEQAEAVRLLGIKKAAERYVAGKAALKPVRVTTLTDLDAKLADDSLFRKHKGSVVRIVSKTLDLLKEQIMIYTHGVQAHGGVTFPNVAWSCTTDPSIGTIATLTRELKAMIVKTLDMVLPAEPPLEVSTGRVLTLGAGAPGQEVGDLANEQEAYRTAVMGEVARQEAGAGAGAPALVVARRPAVPMPMPPTDSWVGRDIQVLHADGAWRSGRISAVSKEGDVRQVRRGGGRAAAGGERGERSDLVPAGRVQVEWERSDGLPPDYWHWLRVGLQFPLCQKHDAWRVLMAPLPTM